MNVFHLSQSVLTRPPFLPPVSVTLRGAEGREAATGRDNSSIKTDLNSEKMVLMKMYETSLSLITGTSVLLPVGQEKMFRGISKRSG